MALRNRLEKTCFFFFEVFASSVTRDVLRAVSQLKRELSLLFLTEGLFLI